MISSALISRNRSALIALAAFSVLWIDLIHQLSYTWDTREQYSYGWFVPFFALALLWRRWHDRPLPQAASSFIFHLSSFCFLICLLPLRVIFEINADWPLIAWIYAIIVVWLTLFAFYLAGGWSWVKHFAFPVAFILVAITWPYRIEKGLTQNMMQVVSGITVEILGFFNIAAVQRGNLIEVATGVVGVDEACSGIRSFQSTLMAGLLMGELYRFRAWTRTGLVIGGLILAFGFNILRALFLTWQASQYGIEAIDKWHDTAGLSITVACVFCLWGISSLLKRNAASADRAGESKTKDLKPEIKQEQQAVGHLVHDLPTATASSPCLLSPVPYLLLVGLWTILVLGLTQLWYRSSEVKDAGVFTWTVKLPEDKPGFQKVELPPRTLKLLAFDEGATGKWLEEDGSEFSVYFFRWKPRSVQSVIMSRVHRPEVCLTATGLQQTSESKLVDIPVGSLNLPFRMYTFTGDNKPMYVFFCQWEDGSEQQSGLASSKQRGRIESVLKGRRSLGQQTLEIIITGSDSIETAQHILSRHLPSIIMSTETSKVACLKSVK